MQYTFGIGVCLIVIGLVVGAAGMSPQARAQEGGICPFVPRAGRTIVHMNDGHLLSHASAGQAVLGPYPVLLEPGNYRVWLASYDNHDEKPGQIQLREQWFAELRNSGASMVAQSNAIRDLPEDENEVSEVVNTNLEVGQHVASVLARHAAYPDPGINSIVPVCAAFDLLPQITPTVSPSPGTGGNGGGGNTVVGGTPTPTPSLVPTSTPVVTVSPTVSPSSSPVAFVSPSPVVLQAVTVSAPTSTPSPIIPTEVAATGGYNYWVLITATAGITLAILPRKRKYV